MADSFKSLKIIRESVIETLFVKAYDYVNLISVPLRMSGREQ